MNFPCRNTITYKNAKTILNGKYLVNGKEIASGKLPEKGSTSGELEVCSPLSSNRSGSSRLQYLTRTFLSQIVLPSGFKLTGKGADSWDLATKQAESLYGLTVQEAGKGPRDINLKIVGKNFDTDPIQFDTSVTLSYVNPDKKDAILHAILKKVPKDGKWIVKGEVGVKLSNIFQFLLALFFQKEENIIDFLAFRLDLPARSFPNRSPLNWTLISLRRSSKVNSTMTRPSLR